MIKLFPYKKGSASAKALAGALGIKRIKLEGSKWKPKANDVIINWGSSALPVEKYDNAIIINKPDAVKTASDKLRAFEILSGHVPIPSFTKSRDEAVEWLIRGSDVVARRKLNGHSGEGIEIVLSAERVGKPLPVAPLYTQYIKKEQEYRIHVAFDKVIFVQRKARKLGVPDDKVNWQVRNHANGFIYAHQNVELPMEVGNDAIEALHVLDLHFGAVDIITTKKGKHFILEVNTACGLEGETLNRYAEAFKKEFVE